ncbi:Gfo/Idh/MocA family oxidoreductase [Paenibacillus sp.]|uniref:Gfo/Idh/MocA family protein n=1 Tax=Paenibacillus sp. TaxID=58172 RepID=UPI0028110434|nr:Gfo/Idh/MocA family oxidoreductase [Paenibacillus sp.]
MKGEVSVGLIGCGRVAESHVRALRRVRGARLAGVYDRAESFGRERAAAWGTSYLELEEMLASPDIDAIYVLTPMESHCDYARKALEAGKHVLIEKPVSDDIAAIRELIELSERQGRVCMPGHSYLYMPELSRMQRLAREGGIGRTTSMFMSEVYRMPDELAAKYHGPIVEVLCHHLYLLLALLGTPKYIQAFAGCFRPDAVPTGDEQVVVNAEYENGALAHLFLSWANHDETSDPWTFKVKLLGTQGGLHFSRRDQVYGNEHEQREYHLYDEMFERESEHFIHGCILGGEAPLSTLDDAAKAMAMLHAVQTSVKERTVQTLYF